MARLLSEIEWEAPLLAARPEADYQAEVMARMSPWLRQAIASLGEPQCVSHVPLRLAGIAYFVASQENSCRFCYGLTRAIMRISGYTERQIQDLEHEASLAGGLTRHVVEFSRKLARSNPSPARDDREALMTEGLGEEAVLETAAVVGRACFANRMSTFLALPPDAALERLSETVMGRVKGWFIARSLQPRRVAAPAPFVNAGHCSAVIAAAGNNPLAVWLRGITDAWLASDAIPLRSRLLMLAVISRQLGSQLCERETLESLAAEGCPAEESSPLLATLSPASMTPLEATLLRWTRETVWYEPRSIQASTRRLMGEIGEGLTLEAIGTAALSNTLARLSLVRQ
jgi:alkylhydroperoxidase family enzyme